MFQQDVGLNQLEEPVSVMCFCAKWHGQRKTYFHSDFHDGHLEMVAAAHDLLDQADVVVHYNGKRFDVPHLNREFLLSDLGPPSPYKQVDLLHQVRKNFKFPSNKLAYVSEALHLGGKVKHSGFELWKRCMAGEEKAWNEMRRYNVQDVRLLEDLYNRLSGWLSVPNFSLYGGAGCPACGSANLKKRGFAYTPTGQFQQYRCDDCGKYSRGKKAIQSVDLREVS